MSKRWICGITQRPWKLALGLATCLFLAVCTGLQPARGLLFDLGHEHKPRRLAAAAR
jgi:hypothetical protein